MSVIVEVVGKVYVKHHEISPPVHYWSNAMTPLLAPIVTKTNVSAQSGKTKQVVYE